jgi:hypothetical protein
MQIKQTAPEATSSAIWLHIEPADESGHVWVRHRARPNPAWMPRAYIRTDKLNSYLLSLLDATKPSKETSK